MEEKPLNLTYAEAAFLSTLLHEELEERKKHEVPLIGGFKTLMDKTDNFLEEFVK